MMMIQNQTLILIMAAAGTITLGIAWFSWRRKNTPGSTYFSLLMLAVAAFALTGAAEFASVSIPIKITWSKLSYLGVASVAPLWFLFAFRYSQQDRWLTPFRIALLWVVPLVTLCLAFTNDLHHWIWPAVTPITPDPGARLVYAHGIAWWAHAGYAYILMLAGSLRLIRTVNTASQLQRRRVIALVAAALIPWVGNLLYLLDLNPLPGLDLTIVGFAFTGLIVVFSIFRFGVFDWMPVAHDVVFRHMSDGLLVINNQNQVVELNPVAGRWFASENGGDASGINNVLGKDIAEILPLGDEIASLFETVREVRKQVEVGDGPRKKVLDLTISPIYDEHGLIQGRIALLHNITNEFNTLVAERRHARQMELLNTTTSNALSTSSLSEMLQNLAEQLGELFDADGAYLTLWDEGGARPIPAAAYGQMQRQYPLIETTPGEKTVTESVLELGQVLVIEDSLHSPHLSARIAAMFPTQSILALPLIASGRKLGAAIISHHRAHRFSVDEISLGEQAAAQISLAIYKTQLYERELARVDQLAALQSISQTVASTLELDQIFNTVVNVLRETFKYSYVSIYLLKKDHLRLGAQVGYFDEDVHERFSIDEGVVGRTVRSRQPQLVRDVTLDPDYVKVVPDVISEICVPLLKQEKVLGVMNIEDTSGHSLTETDLMLLNTFAGQVAVAIDNARLFRAEREQREFADALREMGMAISESLDLESVLDRILEEIQHVLPYDRGSVMLLDEEKGRATITRMRYGDAFDLQTVPIEYKVASTAILRNMTETGRPLTVPDTANNPDWKSSRQLSSIRSWVGAPILLHNSVIGFLSLDKNEAEFYQTEHGERLSYFANQAAIAIENARIFTEVQDRAEKERIMLAATRDFTAGLDTEAILQAVADHLTGALHGERCKIYRWLKEDDFVLTELDFDRLELKSVYPGEKYDLVMNPLMRAVLNERQPILLEKNSIPEDLLDPTLYEQLDNADWLVLPLVVGRGHEVFGVVGLSRGSAGPTFSENDLEIAQNLTSQAAIALENAQLYLETQQQAIRDELTSLYNRRGFNDMGRREFERAVRFQYPLSTLFIDIDFFKQFNDEYSYAVGDQVLRLVANCLTSNVREFDLVARYGGEEFIVLLPDTDSQSALQVAERVHQSVGALSVLTEMGEARISVSVGVVEKNPDMDRLEDLVQTAGRSLHEAKERGRNQIVY